MGASRRRGREALFLAFSILVAAGSLVGTLSVFLGDDSGGARSDGRQVASGVTDFRPPQPYVLGQLAGDNPLKCLATDVACVRTHLAKVTTKHGPRAAVALLTRHKQDGGIAEGMDDHNLAHRIGRQTAERFGFNARAFSLCPIAFNYGCPHGYFEHVLGRAGSAKDAAATICDTLRSSAVATAQFSCYHGVGHGVMMAEAYDLDRSLAVCNSLGQAGNVGCWQGVFMENVNAAVRNEARAGLFSRDDPLRPCKTVEPRYRHQCFINHAGWLMLVAGNSVPRATQFCLHADAQGQSSCLQSIGLMVTNPAWQKNLASDFGRASFARVAWNLCTGFPDGTERECVIAGVDNLGNFDRLDVERSNSFCSIVTASLRAACFHRIGMNLGRVSADLAVRKARCRSLPGRHVPDCLAGAGVA